MKLAQAHVVVVGGAIGGAATALLLAGAGARVTLLERVARPRAVGAGIGLAENGLAVLESLGLGPAIAGAARELHGMRIVDGRRRPLMRLPEPAPRLLMIARAALQGALLDAVERHAGIECHFGHEVVAATPAGQVTAHGERGALTLQSDLVVGADGVGSKVREGADFGARVSPPGIAYLRTLVPGGPALTEEAWTSAGIFGSFPVSGDRTYVYASAGTPACRAAMAARDLDGLRTAWRRAYPAGAPLLGAVERFDDLLINQVVRVECARWSVGRLVLLGDAAHAMAPNLGQGANSALVDAAVLLDELRRHETWEAGLAAYEARRAPAVRWVATTAARLGALAERTNPIVRWVRDRVVMPATSGRAALLASRVLQEPIDALRAIAAG